MFAVSDNTRHRLLRRPISINTTTSKKTQSPHITTNLIMPTSPSPLETSDSTALLPSIPENDVPMSCSSPSTIPGVSDNQSAPSTILSPKQVHEILQRVTAHLETYGQITPELLRLLDMNKTPSKVSTSTTPSNRPTLLSSDKMSNTAPATMRFTVQQLSRYFGFHFFKNWEVLHDVCQPNFSFIKPSDDLLELGQVVNIKKSRSNKTPLERHDKFLEVVHCDIGFGDCKSIGNGALYCLTLVDRATRYSWIYPLKSLHHESLKPTFQQWFIDCGGCPSRLYADFDPKILEGPTASFLRDHHIFLRGAPSSPQNQNSLVERAWETATNLVRAFITNMQIPKNFWDWALRQSIQVMNYFPCTVSGVNHST